MGKWGKTESIDCGLQRERCWKGCPASENAWSHDGKKDFNSSPSLHHYVFRTKNTITCVPNSQEIILCFPLIRKMRVEAILVCERGEQISAKHIVLLVVSLV